MKLGMDFKFDFKHQVVYVFAAKEPLPSEIVEIVDMISQHPRLKAALLQIQECSAPVLQEIHIRLRSIGIGSIAIVGSFSIEEEDTLVTESRLEAIRFVNRKFVKPSEAVDLELMEERLTDEFVPYDSTVAKQAFEKAKSSVQLVSEEPPL